MEYFFQVMSIFFRENCVWKMILVVSFSRAPVNAAYNMFSPVNIFVYILFEAQDHWAECSTLIL